jgi:hypothetical protein
VALITEEEIAARDDRLDKLEEAVNAYTESERNRILSETKFLQTVLLGRGAEGSASANLLAGAADLELEIGRYLFVGT